MIPPPVAAVEAPHAGGPLVHLKELLKRIARGALLPLVQELARLGVRPDHVTVAGCLLSVGAGIAFFLGAFRWGAALVAMGGLCDILDGQLALELERTSRFGAFLDSTLDRLGEAAILSGIAGFYIAHLVRLTEPSSLFLGDLGRGPAPVVSARMAMVAVLALVGSFLVSYTRARAEGLGLDCRVGWLERPERLVLLAAAGAFGVGRVMSAALLLLAILSFATAARRVAHVWSLTRARSSDTVADVGSDR